MVGMWETTEPKGGLTLFFIRRGNPPDERKEGDADDSYICGFVSVLHICRCLDKFVLCNL